jgi:hypothetical protein
LSGRQYLQGDHVTQTGGSPGFLHNDLDVANIHMGTAQQLFQKWPELFPADVNSPQSLASYVVSK